MTRCPKKNAEGESTCNGFIFHPEYGPERCSNVLCEWNLARKKHMWSAVEDGTG
jgi:hypothetical protein